MSELFTCDDCGQEFPESDLEFIEIGGRGGSFCSSCAVDIGDEVVLPRCENCDGVFEPEQLNSEGLCDRCHGDEWMDCDECGCSFMRSESPSEDTCSDCLFE